MNSNLPPVDYLPALERQKELERQLAEQQVCVNTMYYDSYLAAIVHLFGRNCFANFKNSSINNCNNKIILQAVVIYCQYITLKIIRNFQVKWMFYQAIIISRLLLLWRYNAMEQVVTASQSVNKCTCLLSRQGNHPTIFILRHLRINKHTDNQLQWTEVILLANPTYIVPINMVHLIHLMATRHRKAISVSVHHPSQHFRRVIPLGPHLPFHRILRLHFINLRNHV